MRPTPIAVNKGIFQCFPFSSLSVVSYWFIAAVTISNYRRRWRLFSPPSPPSPMQSFTFMIFMFHWFLCTCLIAKDFHLFSHFPPPFPDWFSVSQILRDALRWFYILLKISHRRWRRFEQLLRLISVCFEHFFTLLRIGWLKIIFKKSIQIVQKRLFHDGTALEQSRSTPLLVPQHR